MDRRRFLLGAAPAVVGAGIGASITPGLRAAASTPIATKARRGVGLGTQRLHWSVEGDDVALTFDDGPDAELTPVVLDLLERFQIPATFMVIGAFAQAEPNLMRRIVDEGHELGNHTWTHPDLSTRRPEVVRDELRRTHDVLSTYADIAFFRPPRGQLSGVALQAAAELGYDVLLWSTEELESLVPGTLACWHDGLGRGGFLPQGAAERERRRTKRKAQLAALPAHIEAALDRGVRFVAASHLSTTD